MDDVLVVALAEASGAAGDDEAGGQSLQVELERAVQGLVEVVDVEEQVTFRGGEQPEVDEVGVAAELDLDVGARTDRRGRRPSGAPRPR